MSATNRGAVRAKQDLYETPSHTINSLLSRLDFSKIACSLEPCRASGRIYSILPGNKLYCELSEGIDYLSTDFGLHHEIDLIITNPPFSLALEFLEKSLSEATTVVYLLRLNFLGSYRRKRFWEKNRPTHLYVLSQRPSFTGQGTDATEYAWFVWDHTRLTTKDSPGIYVI